MRLLLTLGCVALSIDPTFAQTVTALSRRFHAAVQAVAPDWQPDPRPRHRQRTNIEGFHWKGPEKILRVVCYHAESVEQAEDFVRRLILIPVPTKEVSGFGDQAFLVAPASVSGERRLVFRRGRVAVDVTATGEESLLRFSRVLAESVEEAIRVGEILGQ